MTTDSSSSNGPIPGGSLPSAVPTSAAVEAVQAMMSGSAPTAAPTGPPPGVGGPPPGVGGPPPGVAGPPPGVGGPPPGVGGPPPGYGGTPLHDAIVAEHVIPEGPHTGPYESIREYIEALDATGNLVHVAEMDQDEYETTAFVYRSIETIGYWKAPALLVDRVKIDGEWVEGPFFGNAYGPWAAEALCVGVPMDEITGNHEQMYRKALDVIDSKLGFGGIPKIAPVEVERDKAPVKEVTLTGDEIDLTKFAFIQTNPADAGRYMTTGSVIMLDPVLGKNVGTYRCQIKGPRQIGVNPEPGQDGWRMIMAAKQRGEKTMKCSIVMGADPMVFTASSTKLGGPFQDELAQAGGLRGRPVQIVKSENSDIMVPAHAEMVIEGEIPLDEVLPEGPFAELYGYLGMAKDENFFMNVTAVTHRPKPIIVNAYTGIARAYCTAPVEAGFRARFRLSVPGLVNMHILLQALGVYIVQIDKTKAGQGITAGMAASSSSGLAKVVIVVDKDVNIYRLDEVMAAFGSRWQPVPGTLLIPQSEGVPLDPSAPTRGLTSRIIIDATRQFPEEGGPKFNAPVTRTLLEEMAPNAFSNVDAKWDTYFTKD